MKKLIIALAIATLTIIPAVESAMAQNQSALVSDAFPSPYMNAAKTPLVEIANGAKVGKDTADYWNLPTDSSQRTSYDKDIVVEVADGVWTIGTDSIVNVQVVEGPDGLIVYDTGDNNEEGLHFYQLLRTVTQAPIRAIIYSHEHYLSGTKVIIDEEAKRGNRDIKLIGHPNTNESMSRTGGLVAVHPEVASVMMARAIEQFNIYLPDEGPDSRFKNTVIPRAAGFVPVNTPVENGQKMRIAGLDVVFYTEGIATDSNNQVMVWFPERKIVMNNIVWGWFPNIYSVRGGRYRNPEGWVEAIDIVDKLKPEILLTTHATSLSGSDAIGQRLSDFRDGLNFVLDQTLKAILLGWNLDELQYAVKLPPRLQDSPVLVQNYGELRAMSPRIYTAIFGQFDRNASTLNKLHPQDEAARMVKAMGGESAAYDKSMAAYKDGDFIWSCQIADYLLKANSTQKNRQLKANCLREMGYRALSTNSRSWYLSQALELEGKTAILKVAPAAPAAVEANLADYVDFYRVRINPERSAEVDKVLAIRFDDKQTYALHVKRSVVYFIPDLSASSRKPDVTVSMAPEIWTAIFNNVAAPSDLVENGSIKVDQGDAGEAKKLFSLFDPIYDWKNDKALQKVVEMLSAQ